LNLNPEAELVKLTAFPTRIPIGIIKEFRGHLHFLKEFIMNSAERYNLFLSAKDPETTRISIRTPVRKVANFA
jgi:hypothetical protein